LKLIERKLYVYEKDTDKEVKKAAMVRLEGILRDMLVDPPEFQKKYGIDSQTWNNWKNRGLPTKEFVRVSLAIGVNTDWLVTGKGQKNISYIKTDPEPVSISEQGSDYIYDNKETAILNYFKKLTIKQQQAIINNAREMAHDNEQIINELKSK
jgi:hypothetical protein